MFGFIACYRAVPCRLESSRQVSDASAEVSGYGPGTDGITGHAEPGIVQVVRVRRGRHISSEEVLRKESLQRRLERVNKPDRVFYGESGD